MQRVVRIPVRPASYPSNGPHKTEPERRRDLGWRRPARLIAIMAMFAVAMWPGRSIAAPPTFAIPPGALGDALTAFAQQSHQQMLFAPEVVRGKRAHGVRGTMPPDRALQ